MTVRYAAVSLLSPEALDSRVSGPKLSSAAHTDAETEGGREGGREGGTHARTHIFVTWTLWDAHRECSGETRLALHVRS